MRDEANAHKRQKKNPKSSAPLYPVICSPCCIPPPPSDHPRWLVSPDHLRYRAHELAPCGVVVLRTAFRSAPAILRKFGAGQGYRLSTALRAVEFQSLDDEINIYTRMTLESGEQAIMHEESRRWGGKTRGEEKCLQGRRLAWL